VLLDASLALGHPTTLPFEGVVEPLHLFSAANVLSNCFSFVETQNQSKCYLALQIMDPIPQQISQHRRIPKAPFLRRVVVQVQTFPTVIDPYVNHPFQYLVPPNLWLLLSTHQASIRYHGPNPDGIVG
jgi:hypothetical protein